MFILYVFNLCYEGFILHTLFTHSKWHLIRHSRQQLSKTSSMCSAHSVWFLRCSWRIAVNFHEAGNNKVQYINESVTSYSLPVAHRCPTLCWTRQQQIKISMAIRHQCFINKFAAPIVKPVWQGNQGECPSQPHSNPSWLLRIDPPSSRSQVNDFVFTVQQALW